MIKVIFPAIMRELNYKIADVDRQIRQLQILKLELQGLLSETNVSDKSDTVYPISNIISRPLLMSTNYIK